MPRDLANAARDLDMYLEKFLYENLYPKSSFLLFFFKNKADNFECVHFTIKYLSDIVKYYIFAAVTSCRCYIGKFNILHFGVII